MKWILCLGMVFKLLPNLGDDVRGVSERNFISDILLTRIYSIQFTVISCFCSSVLGCVNVWWIGLNKMCKNTIWFGSILIRG